MIKRIFIEIVLDEENNKLVNAIKVEGFGKNLSSQLEILGILDNLTNLQRDKLKILGRGTNEKI